MTKLYRDFLLLLNQAVRGKALTDELIQTPLGELFRYATFHSVEVMLFPVISQRPEWSRETESFSEWEEAYHRGMRKYFLFEAERAAIVSRLAERGIWHLPLKGLILKDSYPCPFYRQMTDNDILFDASFRKEVKEIMLERSFTVYSYKSNRYDDVYFKEPIYNFEMHRRLSVLSDFKAYFDDIESRLLPGEHGYSREMSEEDFYLYILSHELKHYLQGGIGLKYLVDFFYYYQQRWQDLDVKKVDAILEQLDFLSFDRERREMISDLFGDDVVRFDQILESPMLHRYFDSGTHGTLSQAIETKLKPHGAGIKAFCLYYMREIFPEKKWFLTHHPWIWKSKVFLPFYVLYRLIRGLFNGTRWRELLYILKQTLR